MSLATQRMKGQGNQVSNGPKEQLGEGAGGSEDFESWRSQQQQQQGTASHTPYGATAPISSATDLYGMSTAAGYYGSGGTFPYQAYGVGDGTWSNGTDMTFLGGYAHDSYSMDGMFGPSTTFSTTAFGQPSTFNYFHGNGDYSTWGTQLNQQRKAHYDDYYRADTQNIYATPQAMQDTNLALKSVEQGMQNLDLKASTSEPSKDSVNVQPKKLTWASIASQPAKPQVTVQNSGLKKKGPGMPPGPMIPGKHNMDIGTWDTSKNTPPQLPVVNNAPPKSLAPNLNVRPSWTAPMRAQSQPQTGQLPARPSLPQPSAQHMATQSYMPAAAVAAAAVNQQTGSAGNPMLVAQHQLAAMAQPGSGINVGLAHVPGMIPTPAAVAAAASAAQLMPGPGSAVAAAMMPPPPTAPSHPVLDELRVKNNYNPGDFDLGAAGARFFVIKSYSEDDIHRSIKYEIWCSTEHGNKRLDQAFREREKEPAGSGCVFLFFSVNGSGHFCGMAQMMSAVDYNCNSSVWSQDKWKGQFRVRWVYVKDVPNVQLRHIRLENNENKPVTNSRDAQEVPHSKGVQVLRIMHTYRHSTSIFDDFVHYEKRQEEEDCRKVPSTPSSAVDHHSHPVHHHQQQQQQPQQPPHHQQPRAGPGGDVRENHHGGHRGGGGGRNHERDRDGEHRPGGGHRNSDHHGGGGHHKDRGDNSRNRGRGGRNMN